MFHFFFNIKPTEAVSVYTIDYLHTHTHREKGGGRKTNEILAVPSHTKMQIPMIS